MLLTYTIFAGLYGLVIGSFLNVVIHRVPAGLSVWSPRSACPSCETPISARDNVPLLSWALLRAKCRGCSEPISARYPIVEAATCALFVGAALTAPRASLIFAACVIVASGLALSIIDIEEFRLPDPIVATTAVLLVVSLVADGVMSGEWPLKRALLMGAVWLLALGIPWLVTTGRAMGFGDVKLGPILGVFLGWIGYGPAIVGLFAAFFSGAIIGLILKVRTGTRGEPMKIPFGPFLFAGTMIGYLTGEALWDWYLLTFFNVY